MCMAGLVWEYDYFWECGLCGVGCGGIRGKDEVRMIRYVKREVSVVSRVLGCEDGIVD